MIYIFLGGQPCLATPARPDCIFYHAPWCQRGADDASYDWILHLGASKSEEPESHPLDGNRFYDASSKAPNVSSQPSSTLKNLWASGKASCDEFLQTASAGTLTLKKDHTTKRRIRRSRMPLFGILGGDSINRCLHYL